MKKFIALALLAIASLPAMAFRTDTIKVQTKYLATPEDVTVIVPDGSKDSRFPTVYLLNGYGGNHRTWGEVQPRLGELADSYGMVIVMPDGRDSWYWDSPVDPSMQMESFFVKDLIPYIDAHYPTIADRSKRAITGLSMGGHGSLWLAGRHPQLFGSAGSMSGGVDIRPFPKRWKMAQRLGDYEANKKSWSEHTIATMVPKYKDADINITIDCGTSDFFADVNRQLHNSLLEAGVPHDYTERPGAHTRKYWNNSILYHLLFFDRAFNAK